jgi:hypothetical protein
MRVAWALCLSLFLSVVGCGGSKDSVTPHTPGDLSADQIDADPLALLPGSAIVLAILDAKTFFQSGAVGAQVALIAQKLMPIGDEAGFSPSRDVDRVTIGAYALQGADVAAVITGRFDQSKIDLAAQNHTPTKSGGAIVASSYAGRTLYTVNNVGFTVLTPHTALAGTETGIRRTLDRIHDGHLGRDMPSWMIDTVQTKDAALAIATDLSSHEVQSAAVAGLPLPWLQGVKMVRIIGDFHDPGLNIAGTITYADAQTAQAGAQGIRQAGGVANLLSITGIVPQLRNLDVTVDGSNVQCKFAVDDQALRNLLTQVPSWIATPSH